MNDAPLRPRRWRWRILAWALAGLLLAAGAPVQLGRAIAWSYAYNPTSASAARVFRVRLRPDQPTRRALNRTMTWSSMPSYPLPLSDCGPDAALPPPHPPTAGSGDTHDLVVLRERMAAKCRTLADLGRNLAAGGTQVERSAAEAAAPLTMAHLAGPFLPEFKNPCWAAPDFHCLPHFYLIGCMKCGSTEMFERIMNHPQAARDIHDVKENLAWRDVGSDGFVGEPWLPRLRNYTAGMGASLLEGAQLPEAQRAAQPGGLDPTRVAEPAERRVRGDGSPHYINELRPFVRSCPPPAADDPAPFAAGPGCSGFVTTHQVIRAAQPGARVIALTREPGDRAHSSYFYFHNLRQKTAAYRGEVPTAAGFHSLAASSVDRFLDCYHKVGVLAWADRSCGEDETNCGCEPFVVMGSPEDPKAHRHVDVMRSLYSEFLGLWLGAFPRHQVLVLRIEDYKPDPAAFMRRITDHLGLDAPPAWALRNMLESEDDRHIPGLKSAEDAAVKNATLTAKQAMLPETRALLDAFFAPFNRRLADLLGDDRFLYRTPKLAAGP